MKTRITPYLIMLCQNAALTSFWRKASLRAFLRQCKISENFISSWAEDETKRDFLNRLFEKLPQTDIGRTAILTISEHLSEQKSFPDLKGWEDTESKEKNAKEAVSLLREYLDAQKEVVAEEVDKAEAQKRLRELQDQAAKSRQTLEKLNERLSELSSRIGDQKSGYDFQVWFYDLLDFFEIVNRRPYVTNGRQIDGSLTLSGTTYLVELKFTQDQAGATDIDSFYRKVSTKADNTMGVMVSISGYSSTAVQEASGDKTPLLLLDHSHLYLSLGGSTRLSDLIERVRRHASQTCEAYFKIGERD